MFTIEDNERLYWKKGWQRLEFDRFSEDIGIEAISDETVNIYLTHAEAHKLGLWLISATEPRK